MLSGDEDLFSAAASRAARDAALALVTENSGDLMPLCLLLVSKLAPGTYTGEDIRQAVNAAGLFGKPQFYGALIKAAIKAKHLTPTDKWIPMTAIKSHARLTRVYSR